MSVCMNGYEGNRQEIQRNRGNVQKLLLGCAGRGGWEILQSASERGRKTEDKRNTTEHDKEK